MTPLPEKIGKYPTAMCLPKTCMQRLSEGCQLRFNRSILHALVGRLSVATHLADDETSHATPH